MDTLLIVFLTLLNGAFAMSELALASSRKARLTAMAEAGDKGSVTALQLLDNPTQFLSSVQVGITSIGMLNGIVGEAAFSDDLGRQLVAWGLTEATASVMATAIVVVVITFITIVFGELVPKRIGQLYPEAVARWVSRPMAFVAQAAKPFVWLLTHTTQWVLKLLRIDTNAVQHVTEEEINASLEEGVDAGIIEEHEHQMVRNVFLLDDRQLTSIMVPHSEIEWLDAEDRIDAAVQKAWTTGHSWYPVCRGGLDDVVGVIHLPRMLALQSEGHNEPLMQPRAAGRVRARDAQRHGAAGAVPRARDAHGVRGRRVRRGAGPAHAAGHARGHHRRAVAARRGGRLGHAARGRRLAGGRRDAGDRAQVAPGIDELPDEDKGRYNTVAGLMQTVAGDLLGRASTWTALAGASRCWCSTAGASTRC
jgi:putative hemolysin